MTLSFGVTVMPDPPYQRLIDRFTLAERLGFDHAWTYDSHVLWQESTPTLARAMVSNHGRFVARSLTGAPAPVAA